MTPELLLLLLSLEGVEFCLARKDDGDEDEEDGIGDEGDDNEDDDDNPKSFLALTIKELTSASGPNANLIISFSPWSCIRSRPMIFEAFSGSKFWILEKTILVASYPSMLVCLLVECFACVCVCVSLYILKWVCMFLSIVVLLQVRFYFSTTHKRELPTKLRG